MVCHALLIMPDHIHMLVHVAMARAAEDVGPYLGLSKTMAARNRPTT